MDSEDTSKCSINDSYYDELPAAKKICLDNEHINSSFANENKSVSETSFQLGSLFSPNCSLGTTNKEDSSHLPLSNLQVSNCDNSNSGSTNVSTVSFSALFSQTDSSPLLLSGEEESTENELVRDESICSSILQKCNLSTSSTQAFGVDQGLTYMDETCVDCNSCKDNPIINVTRDKRSIEQLNDVLGREKTFEFNENNVGDTCKITKENSSNQFEDTLDFTCKPETFADGTILCEETLILCQSINNKKNMNSDSDITLEQLATSINTETSLNIVDNSTFQVSLSDSTCLSFKCSLADINKSAIESENIINTSSKPITSGELLQEVSGLALDYTCSQSVYLDNSDITNNKFKVLQQEILESSSNVIPQNINNEKDSELNVTKSDAIIYNDAPAYDNHVCLAKEKNVSIVENQTNKSQPIIEINNSICSDKCFNIEEVNFLKNNLLKVMELLKNENNIFEAYKLAKENEMIQLLEKIKNLETNVIMNSSSSENALYLQEMHTKSSLENLEQINSKKDTIEIIQKHNSDLEQLNKMQEKYKNLLDLVLITEVDLRENLLFINIFRDFNICTDGLFIPLSKEEGQYVLNYKILNNIMLPLSEEIVKNNSLLKVEYNKLLKQLDNSKLELEDAAGIKKKITEFRDLEIKLSDSEVSNENLRSELSGLIKSFDELKDSLSASKEEKELLVKKNDLIQAELDMLNDKNTELKVAVDELTSTCENLRKDLHEQNMNYKTLEETSIPLHAEITSLKSCIDVANDKMELLQNEIVDIKTQYESSQKSLLKAENKNEELVVSCSLISKEIVLKNEEIFALTTDKEQLKDEIKTLNDNNLTLKEKLIELQENHCSLEAKYTMYNDELSKLQLDFNDLNRKYNEVLSNFDLYKLTHTSTEDEHAVLKNENNVLECELVNYKSKLESITSELMQLKTDYEECNNNYKNAEKQLHEEKLHFTNSYESLKSKYEEAVADINKKLIDFQDLGNKLSDSEVSNENLKSELSKLLNSFNNLKEKLDEKELLATKNECNQTELDNMYHQNNCLEKKIDELKLRYENLQEDLSATEMKYITLCSDHSKLQLDFKGLNAKYNEAVTSFDLYKQNYTSIEDEQAILRNENSALESDLVNYKSKLESITAELMQSKTDYEECNNNYKNAEKQLHEEKLYFADSYDSLKSKYEEAVADINNKLIDIHDLENKLSDSEVSNENSKSELSKLLNSFNNLKDKLEEKELLATKNECNQTELDNMYYQNNCLEKNIDELTLRCENFKEDFSAMEMKYITVSSDHSKLQVDFKDLNAKYNDAIRNFGLYKQTHTSTEDEQALLKNENSALKSELVNYKSKLESITAELMQLKTDYEECNNNYKNAEKQLQEEKLYFTNSYESLKSKYEEDVADINKKLIDFHDLENKLSDSEVSNENLRSELFVLMKSFDELKDSLSASKEEKELLMKKNDLIQAELDMLNDKNTELKVAVDELTSTCENLRKDLHEQNMNYKTLEETSIPLHAEITSLKSCIDVANDKMELLQNEIVDIKTQYESSQKSLLNAENKNEELVVSCSQISKEIVLKNEEIFALTTDKEQLKDEIKTLNDNNLTLKEKLIELQENHCSLEVKYTTYNDEHSKLQLDFNDLNRRYNEVLSNFDIYKQTHTSTEDEQAILKNENSALISELVNYKSKLESITAELMQLKTDYEECKNNYKNAEKQLHEEKLYFTNSYESLKSKYEEDVADINKKLIDFHDLENKLSDSEVSNENLRSELFGLMKSFDELKDSLSASKEEKELLMKKNDLIQAELDMLNDKNTELKVAVDELTSTCENLRKDLHEQNMNYKTLEETSIPLHAEITSLKSCIDVANDKMELLQNEIVDIKTQYESSQKSLLNAENKNEELVVSCSQISKEIVLKNEEIFALTTDKEQLKDEIKTLNDNNLTLKEKLIELQENHCSLEVKYTTYNDEHSKLQLDFNDLNRRYNEVLSNFDIYKQTHTSTEDEQAILKNENSALISELVNYKSKLESITAELMQLKTDYEECNNNYKNAEKQLHEEKLYFTNSYESLKSKYEEAVADINKKLIDFHDLENKLSDSEVSNENLRSELSSLLKSFDDLKDSLSASKEEKELLMKKNDLIQAELDMLNDKNTELKVAVDELTSTCENLRKDLHEQNMNYKTLEETSIPLHAEITSLKSCIDVANDKMELLQNEIVDIKTQYESSKKSAFIFEDNYNKLQKSYDQISNDLESKNEEVLTLTTDKQQLILKIETLSGSNLSLKEKLTELQENQVSLDKEILKLSNELLSANSKVDSFNKMEKDIEVLITKHKILSLRCNLEKEVSLDEPFYFFSAFVVAVEAIADDFMVLEEKYSEELIKLSNANEQILNLNDQVIDISQKLDTCTKELVKLQENYSSISKQYNNVLESSKESNINYNSLLEKLKASEVQNNLCKTNINALKTEVKEKECIIAGLSNINVLYESAVKQNLILSSQVAERMKENESIINDLKYSEEQYKSLKLDFDKLKSELSDLNSKHESLTNQNNENYKLFISSKERIETLQKEKEELKKDIIKYEKEYQHSLDLVRKNNESMFKMDKQYNENIAKLNILLKENEGYKEQNVSLQKIKNEQQNQIKTISSSVFSLVPGNNSFPEAIKLIGEKLQCLKKIEEDFEEEKVKNENLDEECNLLNEDLKYKDRVIGDMYKDHSTKITELKELLKKEENLYQETLLENSTLKDKIKYLDTEILKLKEPVTISCSSCTELKSVLQQMKIDLVDNSSKVTSLQLQIEENEIAYKKKIHDYRKKVSSLQEELRSVLNRVEENKHKIEASFSNAFAQTESLPIQICGQSGIVQSVKIKEQEERIQKIEKENYVLKHMCQSRLQSIQELKTKLENATKPKTQRNILEEVQNHQT